MEHRQDLPARPREAPACRSSRRSGWTRSATSTRAPSTPASRRSATSSSSRRSARARGTPAGTTPGSRQQRSLAITHAKNLLSVGRRVMIQRYLRKVDTAGETALVFIDGPVQPRGPQGRAARGPVPRGAPVLYRRRGHDRAGRQRRRARARASASSRRCRASSPGADGPLLYARVDLIPDDEGNPVVLEVELTEPSLFFALVGGLRRAVRRRDRRAALTSAGSGRGHCLPIPEVLPASGTLLDAPAYASGDRGGYSSGGRAPGCGPGGRGFKSR